MDTSTTNATTQPQSKPCHGWNVWAGQCTLPAGHKGKHVDRYGDTFRSAPRR